MLPSLPTITLCLALSGCWGNTTTDFPAGLEPLEDNTAALPPPQGGDPYPEILEFVGGNSPDYAWGHARGYIKAPLAQVEQALLDPNVVVDRREITEWTFEIGVEPEYEYSYIVHLLVRDIIDIGWDLNWRLGSAMLGVTPIFLARFQKTFGSTFIDLHEGSIVLIQVSDQITEYQFIEHLDATQSGVPNIQSYAFDLYDSVRAVAKGEPLPVY